MRLPYSWLREVISVGAPGWDVGPDEVGQALVRIGHEVEEVVTLGPVDGPDRGARRLQKADQGLPSRRRRTAAARNCLRCN
jgi:hypothetical protein